MSCNMQELQLRFDNIIWLIVGSRPIINHTLFVNQTKASCHLCKTVFAIFQATYVRVQTKPTCFHVNFLLSLQASMHGLLSLISVRVVIAVKMVSVPRIILFGKENWSMHTTIFIAVLLYSNIVLEIKGDREWIQRSNIKLEKNEASIFSRRNQPPSFFIGWCKQTYIIHY